MKKIEILILMAVIVACSQKSTNVINSKFIDTHKLVCIDTIEFKYDKDEFIGAIHDIRNWKNYIIISDRMQCRVWVFDEQLKLKKIIGSKGRGPQEYLIAPNIFFDDDKLYLWDYKNSKIDTYNDNFEFIGSKILNVKFFDFYEPPIKIKDKMVFSGTIEPPDIINKFSDENCLVVVDSNLNTVSSFFKWNERYDKKDAFVSQNLYAMLVRVDDTTFFAQQSAVSKIAKFNSRFEALCQFGIRSRHFREITDMEIKDLYKSLESVIDFGSKISYLFKLDYDSKSGLLVTSYFNPSDKFSKGSSYLTGKHVIQVYNKNYDCIFDEEIDGVFAFIKDNKIYELINEDEKGFKFGVYKVEEK